jgi:hypothetical protein
MRAKVGVDTLRKQNARTQLQPLRRTPRAHLLSQEHYRLTLGDERTRSMCHSDEAVLVLLHLSPPSELLHFLPLSPYLMDLSPPRASRLSLSLAPHTNLTHTQNEPMAESILHGAAWLRRQCLLSRYLQVPPDRRAPSNQPYLARGSSPSLARGSSPPLLALRRPYQKCYPRRTKYAAPPVLSPSAPGRALPPKLILHMFWSTYAQSL